MAPMRPNPMTSTAFRPARSRRGALANGVINGLLGVPPLWKLARGQARRMMIQRAETLGIPWTRDVAALQTIDWEPHWQAVHQAGMELPANYRASFHGYDAGHLCWEAAFEFEVASRAVHAPLYPEAAADSDRALRQGFEEALRACLPQPPATILDLHCTVGLGCFALRRAFPAAAITGLDFSPHYLAVAHRRNSEEGHGISTWHHALPEATGLASGSFELITAFLLLHEMPQDTSRRILREARRLLKPGGTLAVMDMDPGCGAFQTMPAAIMTLLKSTEPFLDAYLAFDLEAELRQAGFTAVSQRPCSPRHRLVAATVQI